MKKLYTSLMAAFVGVSVFAQQSPLHSVSNGHRPMNPVQRHTGPTSTQSTTDFYCDYGFMDEDYQTNTQGLTYSRYIWDMNMNYNVATGDTSLRWAAVDFSPLYNTDYTASYPYATIASNSYTDITIDSIYFNCGHSNYSGMNDTILVRTLACTSGGYPNPTATVLHTDTIISNVSLTGSNTWLSNGTIGIASNYFINNNTTKFALRVEFYGSHLDTFGITAGFGDLGAGQCGSIPALTNFAMKSFYSPNSYRQDQRFAIAPYNILQLPTSTNQDTYYDCDGSGSYAAGTDSENFLQNWDIWMKATIGGVGIDETNGSLGVGQNIPNPFNGTTEIPYELKNNQNVTLTVYDVAGNQVLAQTQNSSAGHHTFTVTSSNLTAGVYYYTVATTEGKVTHKMVITQ